MRVLSFIFLFINSLLLAQSDQNIVVIVDELTKSPIPFMVITTENGVFSADENGEIAKAQLENIPFKVVSDTYKAQIFDVGFSEDTIFMEQEAQLLEETKIADSKFSGESYHLGYIDEKLEVFPINNFNSGYSNTIVIYIPFDGKKAVIENLLFKLHKYEKDSLYTCMIMSVDENQWPGEVIFSYTLTGKALKKKDPIDISSLEIKIPEQGIFVGIKSTTLTIRKTKTKYKKEVAFSQSEYGEDKPKKYSVTWFPLYEIGYKKFDAPPFGVQMKLQ